MKKRIDKDQLTHEEKLEKYRAGDYLFKAPPVCTAAWDDAAWIKFIDACNGWLE